MRLVFIFGLLILAFDAHSEAVTHPILQQDLIALKKLDQDALLEGKMSKQELLDLQTVNTAKLKNLVQQYGWPSLSKVGKDAAQGAWLLVQHADNDRAWQREALGLMEALTVSGDIDKSNIAYLRDRLSIAESQTQLYGSQGRCVAKNDWQPFTIVDPEKIEVRRSEMNMTTLPEYVARASNMCRNFVTGVVVK